VIVAGFGGTEVPSVHDPKTFLIDLLTAAIDRARPERVLPPWVERLAADPPRGRTIVVGAGKASAAMAAVFARHWPAELPLTGAVVTRYGYLPSDATGAATPCRRIALLEAAHPTPDEAGVVAARQMLALASQATADDRVVCLLSGGGSALLPLTHEGVGLRALQAITDALLMSGATIAEINCVRKHLSAILGGRLAAAAYPAPVVTLAISDVPGDDPAVIASGPTVADPTTCAEALALLDRYAIAVSPPIRAALASGAWETPKPGDPRLAATRYHLIATPWESLAAAADKARQERIAVWLLADDLEGESRVIAGCHAALARTIRRRATPVAAPALLLSGGETTVTLTDRPLVDSPGGLPARGGRNSEFALALALALAGEPGVWALAADTDGIDGSETNAGALVTPTTLARAAELGLDPRHHLIAHDAYDFFAALGDLVVTGPTQTNVNDFRAVLILPSDE
jgi:hydroxypyruvate reductase